MMTLKNKSQIAFTPQSRGMVVKYLLPKRSMMIFAKMLETTPAKMVAELLQELENISSQAVELEQLKAALKSCREAARNNFSVTTRDFASMCVVSATQISEWTSDPITTEPDFKD